MAEHHLDASLTQPFWDNSVTPRLTIEPGDVVTFECLEATGQLTPESTVDDYANLDRTRVHALTGSVDVQGARPGDALEVEILDMRHKGWGWTGHRPGFGLLAEDFDAVYLHHWRLDGADCHFGAAGIVVPFAPMPGCVGVAPKAPGRLDTKPPRQNGGNVDIRDLTVGTTFWLPVLVEGALFATGDCHAAQGQGEVCGTGIEAPMTVTMRFDVRKDLTIDELQYRRPGPARPAETLGCFATSAHGPDLYENSRNAIRYLIAWLVAERDLTPSQAYVLCSAAADLVISEVVDAPNWLVSAQLPLGIFRS